MVPQGSISATIVSELLHKFRESVWVSQNSDDRMVRQYHKECKRAVFLTLLLKEEKICDKCWASSIIEVAKFKELRDVYDLLPDHIKKKFAFPRYPFEMEMCVQGCLAKISAIRN